MLQKAPLDSCTTRLLDEIVAGSNHSTPDELISHLVYLVASKGELDVVIEQYAQVFYFKSASSYLLLQQAES